MVVRSLEQEIRRYLGNVALVGREIRCFDVMDSTNTYLKKAVRDGAVNGTVVIADHQTAGRGRMERLFQSSAGKGLYLSLLLRPQLPPENLLPGMPPLRRRPGPIGWKTCRGLSVRR